MAICRCPNCHSTKYITLNVKSGGKVILNRRCKECGETYLFEHAY